MVTDGAAAGSDPGSTSGANSMQSGSISAGADPEASSGTTGARESSSTAGTSAEGTTTGSTFETAATDSVGSDSDSGTLTGSQDSSDTAATDTESVQIDPACEACLDEECGPQHADCTTNACECFKGCAFAEGSAPQTCLFTCGALADTATLELLSCAGDYCTECF